MPDTPKTPPAAARCPICNRPASERDKPFCSPRCRDADLIRWLDGRYAIPSAEPLEREEDEES